MGVAWRDGKRMRKFYNSGVFLRVTAVSEGCARASLESLGIA